MAIKNPVPEGWWPSPPPGNGSLVDDRATFSSSLQHFSHLTLAASLCSQLGIQLFHALGTKPKIFSKTDIYKSPRNSWGYEPGDSIRDLLITQMEVTNNLWTGHVNSPSPKRSPWLTWKRLRYLAKVQGILEWQEQQSSSCSKNSGARSAGKIYHVYSRATQEWYRNPTKCIYYKKI